jgi:lysozyme family protein
MLSRIGSEIKMRENRDKALDYILASEDMTLNLSPNEPGGASKGGVSVDLLTDYHKKIGKPKATIQDVTNLTVDDVKAVYGSMLLDPLKFDDLPHGVDYRVADIQVNSGVTGGTNILQLALGMWPLTGVMDDTTMARVKNTDAKELICLLGAAWIATKHCSPNWGPSPVTKTGFGHGWSNRRLAADEQAWSMLDV